MKDIELQPINEKESKENNNSKGSYKPPQLSFPMSLFTKARPIPE